MKIKIIAVLLCMGLLLSLAACTQKKEGTDGTPMSVGLNTAEMFTDQDKEIGYSDYVTVKLDDAGSTADGAGVTVDGKTVSITQEGTYLFSGKLSDGQIIVDADSKAKLQIILDGVSMSNSDSAAIYIKQADKVFLTTANGSENSLSVTGDYVQTDDNNIDAAIYSKDDLTLNGAGGLTIQAAYGHGVVSKNDLVVTSGTYRITAAAHGLSGQDSVRIADGSVTIASGKDGIHAENADDASLGFLYIADGNFNIKAKTDGLSASSILQVDAGTFAITTGGGSATASVHPSEARPGAGQQEAVTQTDESTPATKGLKAASDLILNGGSFQIDSCDDALHAGANCTVNAGTFAISTGDDGLHADTAAVINGGTLTIKKSYEGIEGQRIDITGGVISILASDDGLNAAGGADASGLGGGSKQDMFIANEDCTISISGGKIRIDASGDGVDSNGSVSVTGGETYVSGPTNNGNAAFDYNGDASITGGIFVAAGSVGMAQNFGSASTQGTMLVNLSSAQTGTITLADESGTVLVTYTPEKQYQSVVISVPDVEQGKTYLLTCGSEKKTIEMSDIIYGTGHEMGAPGGAGGGTPPDGRTPPDGTMKPRDGQRPVGEDKVQ